MYVSDCVVYILSCVLYELSFRLSEVCTVSHYCCVLYRSNRQWRTAWTTSPILRLGMMSSRPRKEQWVTSNSCQFTARYFYLRFIFSHSITIARCQIYNLWFLKSFWSFLWSSIQFIFWFYITWQKCFMRHD